MGVAQWPGGGGGRRPPSSVPPGAGGGGGTEILLGGGSRGGCGGGGDPAPHPHPTPTLYKGAVQREQNKDQTHSTPFNSACKTKNSVPLVPRPLHHNLSKLEGGGGAGGAGGGCTQGPGPACAQSGPPGRTAPAAHTQRSVLWAHCQSGSPTPSPSLSEHLRRCVAEGSLDAPCGTRFLPSLNPGPNQFRSQKLRPKRMCSWDKAFIGHGGYMHTHTHTHNCQQSDEHNAKSGCQFLVSWSSNKTKHVQRQ